MNSYKYENLSVGQEFKSYRQLCETLGAKVQSSTSKRAQFKEWECYFNYSKQGNRFIITEIYEEPKEREFNYVGGNNKVKYISYIEKLILDLLAQSGDEDKTIFLSKNKLLHEISMINNNYAISKFNKNKLSKELDISLEIINEFYTTSDSMLQRNLETALNNLRSKALIMWKTATTIAYVEPKYEMNVEFRLKSYKDTTLNEYGDEITEFHEPKIENRYVHRKATEEDEEKILVAEGIYLDEMGYKNIQEVIINGDTVNFYKKVKDYLFDFYNIFNYYPSYEITLNKERIDNEVENLNKDLLNLDERILTKSKLNSDVIIQLKNNTENRHHNAMSKVNSDDFKTKDKIRIHR